MARKQLERKVAVVTGASRGLGAAIAEALAGVGFDLAICGRDRNALRSVKNQLEARGATVLAEGCDVREARSVARFFTSVKRKFGRVDTLVNNAGVAGPLANVDKLSAEVWDEVIGTNLTGTFLCTQATLPLMSQGGTIVNNLSVAAKRYFPGMAAYVAAKHGALGFTETLRAELRESGIRVIALMPGATRTAIWQQFWPEAPQDRMMAPESIAAMVVAAITLPENATVEELVIGPTAGQL